MMAGHRKLQTGYNQHVINTKATLLPLLLADPYPAQLVTMAY